MLTRRGFLKVSAGLLGLLAIPKVVEAKPGKYATLIDLTKCDGCKDEPIPLCVKACREENSHRFPVPKRPIPDYWPRKFHEDWEPKKDRIDTLTPYNWIFVQKVNVDGETIYIPRRCMHCDNPPCVRGCPFGALSKQPEGNTVIDHSICFGGAKCRDVCPWGIPQRQAGVGIYLKLTPKFAGGGVMYKCDLCDARIKKGLLPACIEACQKRLGDKAPMMFGMRNQIYNYAYQIARQKGLFIYGDKQNGGTSTLYLSSLPFDKIDAKLREMKARFKMPVKVINRYEEEINPIGKLVGLSALAGVAAGLAYGYATKNKKDEEV
jgi:Fe-S-cluster-containing dehydrogenase component